MRDPRPRSTSAEAADAFRRGWADLGYNALGEPGVMRCDLLAHAEERASAEPAPLPRASGRPRQPVEQSLAGESSFHSFLVSDSVAGIESAFEQKFGASAASPPLPGAAGVDAFEASVAAAAKEYASAPPAQRAQWDAVAGSLATDISADVPAAVGVSESISADFEP